MPKTSSLLLMATLASTAYAEAEQLTDLGHSVLWIAFFGLFIPTVYFYNAAMQMKSGQRYFHVLTMMITAIASLAYLTMATGYGVTTIEGGRPFLYARYIDWTLTTPLMLLDLCGLAGAGLDTTVMLVGLDILMIVAGVIGAFVPGQNKYLFFLFGMVVFMPIIYFLSVTLKAKAKETGEAASAVFNKTASLTVFTWSAYPVVWVLAEGMGVLSPDMECIVYTALDITAKSFFGFLIVNARDGLEQAIKAAPTSSGTPMAASDSKA
jgi:bacteriorhodopsin